MVRIDLDVIGEFCSLPGDELAARQEELRRELLPLVLAGEQVADGYVLEFDASMRSRLDELISFESRCCPALDWRVENAPPDRVRLVIAGI